MNKRTIKRLRRSHVAGMNGPRDPVTRRLYEAAVKRWGFQTASFQRSREIYSTQHRAIIDELRDHLAHNSAWRLPR